MELEQGEKLVKLARKSAESYFSKEKITSDLKEKRGVFVTIMLNKELRGCIGFPEPIYPLGEGVIKAANYAAFSDPRFMPLKEQELDKVRFEVSILTVPELIKVKDTKEYLKKIEIGKDGLIAELDTFKGLLLPQVATEHKWNVERFLNHICLKAGLLEETWQQPSCKIYKFQAEIFKEEEPNGKIVKI